MCVPAERVFRNARTRYQGDCSARALNGPPRKTPSGPKVFPLRFNTSEPSPAISTPCNWNAGQSLPTLRYRKLLRSFIEFSSFDAQPHDIPAELVFHESELGFCRKL